jgi:hypothetical protein
MSESTLVQQNDVILKYTVTDQEGDAVNLTSATIKWAIRKNLQTTVALSKTTGSGISITNAAGGIFEVTLTDIDTENLIGGYIMEAVITDNSGKIYTITNEDITPDILKFRAIYTEP